MVIPLTTIPDYTTLATMAAGLGSEPGPSDSPSGGASVDSSANKANTLTTTSAKDIENPRYSIWLVNGLDIDSLEALLSTIIEDLEVHRSLNGWGVMYWSAYLTPAQAAEIAKHHQVRIYLYNYCLSKHEFY